MKIRNILYGYQCKGGILEPHPQESKIVQEVFNAYLQGKSLLQIAEWLNERKVEYMPGSVAWNKGKIMRMLDDKRYLGDEKHPAIIDQAIHETALKIKYERNDQKGTDRQSDIFQLNAPIRCPKCGEQMQRRVDSRLTSSVKWVCRNQECRCSIAKTDDSLLAELTESLNSLISNPHIVNIPTERESEQSIEIIRLNNEISRLFDSTEVDRDTARAKILEYAALKYQESDRQVCIAQRLKDTFSQAIPLQAFCPHLFERTVDEIRLYTDKTIGIILANRQEIRNGGQYGTA